MFLDGLLGVRKLQMVTFAVTSSDLRPAHCIARRVYARSMHICCGRITQSRSTYAAEYYLDLKGGAPAQARRAPPTGVLAVVPIVMSKNVRARHLEGAICLGAA